MVIAHPLTGSPPLPVPPLVLAAVTVVAAAVVVSRVGPATGAGRAGGGGRTAPRWFGVTRLVAALLLLVLVASARLGPPSEVRNFAAVAVTHVLWPLLLVLAVLLGPLLWRALDPWWGLGAAERLLGGPGDGDAPATRPDHAVPPAAGGLPEPAAPPGATAAAEAGGHPPPPRADGAPQDAGAPPDATAPPEPAEPPSVWPAVVAAAVWAVFLAWHAVAVQPRALATVLGAYTLVMLAGCLAVGRRRWLPRAEAVGLVVSWAGLAGRGRLVRWRPPAGAAALLGALFAAVVFVRFRLGVGWVRVISDGGDPLFRHRALAVAAVAAGAAAAYGFERWAARRGAPGSVAAALVPVVVATVLAAGLRRAMVAAQVLPQVATDPFGEGWRLLGRFGERGLVDINPWGTAVQQGLSVAIVAMGVVAGAWVVARRARGMRARDPGAFAVYLTALLAVLAVTAR